MAKVSVSENSLNSRPTSPPMNSSGMKAATSEMLIESTVKPIWRAPSMVARSGVMPFSRLRKTFSIMTMASSTTKPTDTASAISEMLSIEKPATHIAAQVPASDSGTVTPAASVAAARRRNRNTTSITSAMVASSVSCMSWTLARIVVVRSDSTEISMSAGIQRLSSGSIVVDAVHRVDHVGVGLLGDDEQHRRLQVEPGRRAAVAHAELDVGDAAEPDHGAVGRLHHQVLVFGHGAELVVGADGVGEIGPVEGAERARRIGVGDRGAHVLQAHAHRGDRDRIDADAHRRLLGAVDGDLGDAVDLRRCAAR